jgi:hypothetical protein
MRYEFERRDVMFAKYIVAVLAQRIELGILSPKNGIGFPFTDKEERKVRPPFSPFSVSFPLVSVLDLRV